MARTRACCGVRQAHTNGHRNQARPGPLRLRRPLRRHPTAQWTLTAKSRKMLWQPCEPQSTVSLSGTPSAWQRAQQLPAPWTPQALTTFSNLPLSWTARPPVLASQCTSTQTHPGLASAPHPSNSEACHPQSMPHPAATRHHQQNQQQRHPATRTSPSQFHGPEPRPRVHGSHTRNVQSALEK